MHERERLCYGVLLQPGHLPWSLSASLFRRAERSCPVLMVLFRQWVSNSLYCAYCLGHCPNATLPLVALRCFEAIPRTWSLIEQSLVPAAGGKLFALVDQACRNSYFSLTFPVTWGHWYQWLCVNAPALFCRRRRERLCPWDAHSRGHRTTWWLWVALCDERGSAEIRLSVGDQTEFAGRPM